MLSSTGSRLLPADIERDLEFFRGRTRQYIFISSASAYQKPSTDYLITESTPLANPHWDYSRNKIACEERLLKAYREEGFPGTIVRPSLTYGENLIPLVINSWERSYTVVDRMLKGQKVIVPGDGTSLWVITHNSDFAKGFIGLLGNEQSIGHAFHITTDEVLTWDQLYRTVGAAAGVEPRLVHIPSDFMVACLPEMEGTLIGDKSVSVVFDNAKIKRFVPEYLATTRFAQGIRQSLAWFDADPSAKTHRFRGKCHLGQADRRLRNRIESYRRPLSVSETFHQQPSGNARLPARIQVPFS